jgi:stress-induced morphogen
MISRQCLAELDAVHVECVDVTQSAGDCDGLAKLELTVASPQFDNLRLLQRHQRVNECVVSEFMPQIHAISITTYTSEQHEKQKQQQQQRKEQRKEEPSAKEQDKEQDKEGGSEA